MKPLLFATPMVEAVLNTKPGAWPAEPADPNKPYKCQTRRIVKPLPVFIADNGGVRESVTDKYGWPNTTIDGELMYDNYFFPSRKEAVIHCIQCMNSALAMDLREVQDLSLRVSDLLASCLRYRMNINRLELEEWKDD